ncbi:MAG: hypothetical protein JO079_13410 [Frankiaceae bacterium]|nr:hypothetical protein [Frankiaceae bacterium]
MAAELAYTAPSRPAPQRGARPPLRLAPPPRRTTSSPSRREAAYAVTLGLVLGLGVLGVLALNTLMQQQARTIAAQQAELGALALRTQTVQLQLDALDNPRELARRAQALRMRPAAMLTPLSPAPATKPRPAAKPKVSAPARGTRPAHGG